MNSQKIRVVVAVAALLFPAGLHAQAPAPAQIKVEAAVARAAAFRQSIARETERQALATAALPKKPAVPQGSWVGRLTVATAVIIGVASSLLLYCFLGESGGCRKG